MYPVSRTAAYVAAARAIGAREPDAEVRNPDYLAAPLLGDPAQFDLDLPVMQALAESYEDAMQDLEVAGTVRAMIVRSRFIADALERSVDAGATQVLILGAGLDSHAYRFEPMLRKLRVFEVDRPATQEFKRRRVANVIGAPPSNLRYVATDFEQEDLRGVLATNGYDFAQRSFVIMEGVTMYLDEVAVGETLRLIAAQAPGTSVVFDFVSSALIAMTRKLDLDRLPPAARAFAERFLHLVRDEPWLFGFPLGEERDYIESFGLSAPEILVIGGAASARRYLTRADGSQVGGEALARQLQGGEAQAQAEALAYRITEAVVPSRH